jgi:GTP pyrophosphokinase
MNEISQIISRDLKVNMISVQINVSKGVFNGIIKLMVSSHNSLSDLLQRISRIPGISKAVRL